MYARAEFEAAFMSALGRMPYFGCQKSQENDKVSGEMLFEVYIAFNVLGTVSGPMSVC